MRVSAEQVGRRHVEFMIRAVSTPLRQLPAGNTRAREFDEFPLDGGPAFLTAPWSERGASAHNLDGILEVSCNLRS